MKIRIQNDGQPSSMTKIIDVETGKPLEYTTDVEITLRMSASGKDEVPKAVITTILPCIDVIADADIKCLCPYCGKLASGES